LIVCNYCRLSLKENPFRCSYILPDGITYKKGFVKDLDEARRYCSLPVEGESDRIHGDTDINKFDDRKKAELSQNVTSCVFDACQMLLGVI
jgi:actin-related protein 6